jgi:hypothetical protein
MDELLKRKRQLASVSTSFIDISPRPTLSPLNGSTYYTDTRSDMEEATQQKHAYNKHGQHRSATNQIV